MLKEFRKPLGKIDVSSERARKSTEEEEEEEEEEDVDWERLSQTASARFTIIV